MATTFLAVAASSWAVVMGLSPVLQIRRMLREQSSRQVSVGYFMILLIGFLLWIAYGAAAGILALVVPNIVALLTVMAAITVALRLRRGPAGLAQRSAGLADRRTPQRPREYRGDPGEASDDAGPLEQPSEIDEPG